MESKCCTPETNIIFQINCTSMKSNRFNNIVRTLYRERWFLDLLW